MAGMSGPTRLTSLWRQRLQQTRRAWIGSFLLRGGFPPEHGESLDLDQKTGAAKKRLNAGQRVESLQFEESGTLLVECRIVALDITQVTRGANDVVPGCTLGRQKLGDIFVSTLQLCAEIPDMDRSADLVNAGRSRDQQNDEPVQVDPHAAGESASVVVGFV